MPISSNPEAAKKQLANLEIGRWQPGQSGNPRGRPAAGACYVEWLNAMVGKTEAEIQGIADDEALPAHQRMAARTTLRGLSDEYHNQIPLAANDLDRMSDRTVGKPMQSLLVQHTQSDDPEVLLAELRALLVRRPELLSVLGDRLPVEALPPVDEAEDSPA